MQLPIGIRYETGELAGQGEHAVATQLHLDSTVRPGRADADPVADAFDRVWSLAEKQGISLRQAALVAGINEVAAALKARGIYP